jgi:hypothetical protein
MAAPNRQITLPLFWADNTAVWFTPVEVRFQAKKIYTVKKGYSLFPARESLVSDIPVGDDGKNYNLIYSVEGMGPLLFRHCHPQQGGDSASCTLTRLSITLDPREDLLEQHTLTKYQLRSAQCAVLSLPLAAVGRVGRAVGSWSPA